MRELQFIRTGRLEWRDKPEPVIEGPRDAIVRPFIASRCDGDTLPLHHNVSRLMQVGLKVGLIDHVVASICGPVPFQGPFGIGHECIGQVVAKGDAVTNLAIGQVVVVPWAVSCGECPECLAGVTAKCSTTRAGALSAFGFGPASGPWGGMVADQIRVPFADHMLVPVPDRVDPLRVAAAGDNLADGWRSVVPQLQSRPGGSVLVIGGGGQSIGLYAAGLAVAHRAEVVDYLDDSAERLAIAESLGARPHQIGKSRRRSQLSRVPGRYDIAVDASSKTAGVRDAIRALKPGGTCTATGYYMKPNTGVPLMHMYANDASLRVGISNVRPILPDLLGFVAETGFPAEKVTTVLADWDDAPTAYQARTTKLVLRRAPLDLTRS
jgi:alcohol dehydrogenase